MPSSHGTRLDSMQVVHALDFERQFFENGKTPPGIRESLNLEWVCF